ncbi:helix-turn-helix domain-containing protein [Flavobacterium silvaticum]|uniref:HTH cro/C1-type domain-containing protein n=1 Tax=Flavobacterium silvaticum TaxID=1852020 RepID=A0A972FLQ1_9FLAO|nr:helix-turn-helix domain-containing protein [Flavobacterium silvaticum]NMH27535.1 hypothetical protein [Flavobacterium silvaticum]
MRKKSTTSSVLGLTQLEMAMLLNINPSQYSMYESGLRELPVRAEVLLYKIEIGTLLNQQKLKEIQLSVKKQEYAKKRLENWLMDNTKEIYRTERKIAQQQKKKEIAEKLRPMAQYLNNEEKGLVSDDILSIINWKSEWDGFELERLEVRLETLRVERKGMLGNKKKIEENFL